MTDPREWTEASDEELVERLKEAGQGDLRAFDVLVRRHEAKVTTNCRYISGSPADAPDLTQEVFVKAYFALARFEGRSSFSTWINRIKTNHCINYLNKKRRPTVDVDDPAYSREAQLSVKPEAPRNLDRMDQRAVIRTVLDEMTDTLRVPLIMRDMDGFSYQEIADELGVGLSAVKMRIARGREEFRTRYAELSEEPREDSPTAA